MEADVKALKATVAMWCSANQGMNTAAHESLKNEANMLFAEMEQAMSSCVNMDAAVSPHAV